MKVTQKGMALEASQPLCGNEHEPLKKEAGGGEIIVSMVEYDASGTAVSREDMETTELRSLPPGSFTILEDLSFLE
jgi:hypothetical protein